MPRSNSGLIRRSWAVEGVALDLERQVGEARRRAARARTLVVRDRASTAAPPLAAVTDACASGAHRGRSASAAPRSPASSSAGCPARASGWARCSGCCSSTWLVWLGGSSTLIPYGTGSAAGWIALVCALGLLAAVRRADALRAAARRAAARPVRPAPLARASPRARPPSPTRCGGRCSGAPRRSSSPSSSAPRCSSPSRPTCGAPRRRWTWRSWPRPTGADTFPPADPWLAGAELNYYYLGHLAMAIRSSSRARRARPGLQPRASRRSPR